MRSPQYLANRQWQLDLAARSPPVAAHGIRYGVAAGDALSQACVGNLAGAAELHREAAMHLRRMETARAAQAVVSWAVARWRGALTAWEDRG